MTDTPSLNEYSAANIRILTGMEAVRKRPAMYVGDTDNGSGLHQLVVEVGDDTIDEALAGYCDLIRITLHPDGSVSVEDNGRGMSTAIDPHRGISTAEILLTQLHAGGIRIRKDGRLHGVGVSVVNGLSDWLDLTIWRDGGEHHMRFAHGEAMAPLRLVGPAGDKHGTRIAFLASPAIFTCTTYDFATLERHFREKLVSLPAGVRLILRDERQAEAREVTLSHSISP